VRSDLRDELLALVADDDRVRGRLAEDGSLFGAYHPEMEEVHQRNAARLRAIVGEIGWPGRSEVGEDGAHAAWRILQHAIGEPDLMRGMLPALAEAAAAGEASRAELAMLEDRIRVLEGRPQRYGTQYDWDEAGMWMVPIGAVEDPAKVDTRRRAVGLEPMVWRKPPPPDEPPPDDVEARRRDMDEWARRVGWR
jgi:hypothetical protein